LHCICCGSVLLLWLCLVLCCFFLLYIFFFFNDTASPEISTLSLHDALPIFLVGTAALALGLGRWARPAAPGACFRSPPAEAWARSEEHTSELQSLTNLVCRLLLEKKKKKREYNPTHTDASSTQLAHRHVHEH